MEKSVFYFFLYEAAHLFVRRGKKCIKMFDSLKRLIMLIEKIATKHSFICPFLPENVQLFAYQPSNCKPYSYYIMLVWMYLCVLRVNMFGLAFDSCVCLCVMATINGFHTIAQYHPTNSIQFKPIFIRIILFNMFVNNVLLVLWLFFASVCVCVDSRATKTTSKQRR